jgi:serine phosphatase RsbU (regulator of sigma subunit)/anti-sigma regulatory factor (Ser/Thr protein kinase)
VRLGTIPAVKSRVTADRLADLESITDAALAYLPLETLIDELLTRVTAILGVDTAAILLLEDDDKTLVARAAKGLEEEVERGVRIPVGRGFAGRIAATRRPVRILDLAQADVVNPILREKGLHSLLGVPLVVEGAVVGVLHVGTVQERAFDDEDEDLLQRAADRAGLAIFSRLTERERGLADALQRSLMPRLPELPGVAFAGRYLPAAAARLGGDWYDAFSLPDGRLGMAIGDVVGRGFHAAAIMGQLRSGLRAYALDGMAPGAVLERLSGLLRQLESGRTATLVYLVLDPHGGGLTVATAGHPPPLVGPREGEPWFLELPGSVPLGAARHPRYEDHDVELEPGAAIVLYTDGLVERPSEGLDKGLERLVATVRRDYDDLEHLGDALVDALLPDGAGADDAALLAARALPLDDALVARFPAEIESIPAMRRLLARWLDEAGATQAQVDDLTLASAEAAANAIEHAYGLEPGVVELRAWTSQGSHVKVAIRDFGSWRAPRGEHRGRGLQLMEGLTDEVEVVRSDQGTTIQLSRRLGAEAA